MNADGGDRTHTLLPVLDFESSASANSATSASGEEEITNPFATKRKRLACIADKFLGHLRERQAGPVSDLFRSPVRVLRDYGIVILR